MSFINEKQLDEIQQEMQRALTRLNFTNVKYERDEDGVMCWLHNVSMDTWGREMMVSVNAYTNKSFVIIFALGVAKDVNQANALIDMLNENVGEDSPTFFRMVGNGIVCFAINTTALNSVEVSEENICEIYKKGFDVLNGKDAIRRIWMERTRSIY